jgi:hypothetical protein
MPITSPLHGEPSRKPSAKDNEELAQLFRDDQDDRKAATIDWSTVEPRDRKREARVKELYRDNRLQTGADYYHTAMILQHGRTPEEYLLAHELCIVAISKGEERAKWLAAASEDRFLMNIGRPQRFGTQFRSEGPDSPFHLYKVGPGVTDQLRQALAVPPLKEAEARAAKMSEQLKKAKKP